MRGPALVLLLLVLASGAAAAHGAFDEGAWLDEGTLHLEISGAPLVAAGAPLTVTVRTDAPGPYAVRLVGPDGAAEPWTPLHADGARSLAGIVFPAAGEWTVEARAGEQTAVFRVRAWPAAGAFVEADETDDGIVPAGREVVVRLGLVDAAHAPLAAPEDLEALVVGPDGARRVPLVAHGGLVEARLVLAAGEHQVHVLAPSLGLVEGARPPIHILAEHQENAELEGERKESPGPAFAGAVLALGALAALTRGRRL